MLGSVNMTQNLKYRCLCTPHVGQGPTLLAGKVGLHFHAINPPQIDFGTLVIFAGALQIEGLLVMLDILRRL